MSRIPTNDNPQALTFQCDGKLEGPGVSEQVQHRPQRAGRRESAEGRTMNTRMAFIVSCFACFTLLGCAGEQRKFTGFLSDYSKLAPHPTIQGALVYWNPKIDPKKYKSVIVAPIDLHFRDRNEESRARPEDVAAFRRFVTDELTRAIGKHASIVTEPGANVLRLRLQVANLQFTQSIDEPPHPWPPRDYALGTADIETAAHDSVSGDLIVAYVSPRCGVERSRIFFLTSPPGRWDAAKTALRARIVTWTDHAARHFAPDPNVKQTAMENPAIESMGR